MSPEQRPSVVASAATSVQSEIMAEKGVMHMKVKNNTEATQLKANWRSCVFLVVLHLFVFCSHAQFEGYLTVEVATRALP